MGDEQENSDKRKHEAEIEAEIKAAIESGQLQYIGKNYTIITPGSCNLYPIKRFTVPISESDKPSHDEN